jgi:hypothetical protein
VYQLVRHGHCIRRARPDSLRQQMTCSPLAGPGSVLANIRLMREYCAHEVCALEEDLLSVLRACRWILLAQCPGFPRGSSGRRPEIGEQGCDDNAA